MNTLLLLAFIQLFLSLAFAIVVAFLAYKVIRVVLEKFYPISLDNLAFAYFISGVLLGVGYIISGAIQPVLNIVRLYIQRSQGTWDWVLPSIKYVFIFALVAFIIALVNTILGVILFNKLNYNVDEFEEISKNNQAVGLITGVIIVVIAFFVRDSTMLLLESMIPYPKHFQ
jgi:uncharacterized membrane protein YjfL (UPF0719 family)